MNILSIKLTNLPQIQPLRELFLQERNFQFIYNKCHQYNWADSYLFEAEGKKIGYGSVYGQHKREDRDSIFEFYVIPSYRKFVNKCFERLIEASNAPYIDCQSNDKLLSMMLYQYAKNIYAERILFEDHMQTSLSIPDVIFSSSKGDGDANFVLEKNGEIVATGGFMLNYNHPYADLYMETKKEHRQKGFGSLMVQELKREIYEIGRVPAARCNVSNLASRPTLEKAGLKICGYMLIGEIKSATK